MSDPISFTDIQAGQVVSAATLKGNFDKVNTYLSSTKVDLPYIKKQYASSCVSFNHDTVASSGTEIVHYHAFKPADDIELVQVQLYVRGIQGSPGIKAQLYTAYDGSDYSGAMLSDDLSVASSNTWDTDSSPATTTRLSGQPIYIKVWNTNSSASNDAMDVTLNIWFKSKHRE
tara:strand:+ start:14674 stop:15192 length:519 start_codon:yes stop_codon:yes gene_type:complete